MDASTHDHAGNTPLHSACEVGAEDSVEFLLSRGVQVDARNRRGETPLFLACIGSDIAVVKRLLDARACVNAQSRGGVFPFMQACGEGNLDIAQLLMKAQAEMFAADKQGLTAMHMSVGAGRGATVLTWLLSMEGACEGTGAINRRTLSEGMTPLHWSVVASAPDAAALLLQAQACMDTADKMGRTALHWAANRCDKPLVDLLLAARACVNFQQRRAGTPLTLAVVAVKVTAVQRLHVIRALAHARADVNSRSKAPLEVLMRARADVNLRSRGDTPLIWAARRGDLPAAQLLVNQGARVPGPRGVTGLTAEEASKTQAVKRFLCQCAASSCQPPAKRSR